MKTLLSKCCRAKLEVVGNGEGYSCSKCKDWCDPYHEEEKCIHKTNHPSGVCDTCAGYCNHVGMCRGKCGKPDRSADYLPTPPSSWEEEFDKELKYIFDPLEGVGGYPLEQDIRVNIEIVKSFISLQISKARAERDKEVGEIAKGMRPILWNDNNIRHCENIAIHNFVDKLLAKLQGK